jgi:non-ribosomal peptide synthetase component F
MGCARRGLSAAVDDLARLDVATLFMVWLGFLVNTLALRTSLDGKPTFRSLLAQAKDTTQGAFEHQVQPFTRVVEVLKPAFARSRTPCSRTCFVPRATTCWSSTRSG